MITAEQVLEAAKRGHTTQAGVAAELGCSVHVVIRRMRRNPEIYAALSGNKRAARKRMAGMRYEMVQEYIRLGHGVMDACKLACVHNRQYWDDRAILGITDGRREK